MLKGVLAASAAIAVLAAPAGAQGTCWKAEEASAANIRQLQSMLMVAALRCQAAGHSMMADYNVFVTANKAAISSQNDKLKAHFIRALGPVVGQRAYDSYTTSMANGYGAGASGVDACEAADQLAREAGMMGGSVEGLLLIADRQGMHATLPDGTCDAPAAGAAMTVALNTPAVAAPVAAVAVAAQAATAPIPVDEPMVGDETTPATPVGKVDPAVALAAASAPAPTPVAAAPAPVQQAPAPVQMAQAAPAPQPVYQQQPAYQPAPQQAYQQAPQPVYQQPAPQYAYPPQQPQYAYAPQQPAPVYQQAPAPRYAPPPGYAYPPRYAPQQAYQQAPQPVYQQPAPRYAPPPGYAYAPAPGWGNQ